MTDVFPRRDLPGKAETWGREVEKRVMALEKSQLRQGQSLRGQNRNTASSLQLLSEQVARLQHTIDIMPLTDSQGARSSGFAVSSAWTEVASVTIPTPPGKNLASVMCIANAGILDNLTGGLTTSYGRIIISGSAGPEFPAAKDAGVSNVLNVITASFSGGIVPGDSVTASFELRALNGAAFPALPANFGQVSLLCSFS